MALDYFDWLQEQPERQKLEKQRNELREQFQKLNRDAENAMQKCFAYFTAGERISEVQCEWESTSDDDADSMQKIYGIHPEIFVDYQMDVAITLKQLAFQSAEHAVNLSKSARTTKKTFDSVIDEITKQYDDLKPTWEALQSNNKEESK